MANTNDLSCPKCKSKITKSMHYCPNCGRKLDEVKQGETKTQNKQERPKAIAIEKTVTALLVDAVVSYPHLTSGFPKLPTRNEWIRRKRITVIKCFEDLNDNEKQEVLNELGTLQSIDEVYWVTDAMPWVRFLDKGWYAYQDIKKWMWVMWPANGTSIIKTQNVTIKRTLKQNTA